MKKINVIMLIVIALYTMACNSGGNSKIDETPTRGSIKISVDESFQLLIDTQVFTFMALYPDATIAKQYKPEIDVINDFMNDSVPLIVSSRKLTTKEEEILKSQSYYPRTTKIAVDAVALIMNKNNPDSLLKYMDVSDIVTGKLTKWTQINPKSKLGNIQVIFDNPKSANARYLKEKFSLSQIPDHWSAVNSNEEIVNFIEKNPRAIGLLSVNWISDKDDTITRGFMKKVSVAAISASYDAQNTEYFQPYQSYIFDKSYPLIRDVFIINRESFSGLGSGFAAFVAGEKGQRIILKSGLVPATMPVRLVHISKN